MASLYWINCIIENIAYVYETVNKLSNGVIKYMHEINNIHEKFLHSLRLL